MHKNYGTISPIPTTDNLIYECFQLLTERDQRKFAKKFHKMSDSTAYRRVSELEESGWFELVRRGGNDESGHPLCTIYHIRNLKQWEQWRSQRPTTPAVMSQPSQTQTETCITWLQRRLAKGPVYSDELEPFIRLADIIKVDFRATKVEERAGLMRRFGNFRQTPRIHGRIGEHGEHLSDRVVMHRAESG